MSNQVVIGDKFIINMDIYLDLFQNRSASDPMFVFAEFVKLQIKINDTYQEYSECGRRLSRDKNELEARLRTRLAAKDETNPLVADGLKPTQANVSAWIESSPEYLALKEALDDNQELKNTLGSMRQLIDRCLDMIKIYARRSQDPTAYSRDED